MKENSFLSNVVFSSSIYDKMDRLHKVMMDYSNSKTEEEYEIWKFGNEIFESLKHGIESNFHTY